MRYQRGGVFSCEKIYHFGLSVGKKIGNAVVRNKYKRRIKDILMKNKLNNSNDYVIILRNAVTDILYDKMKYEWLDILKGVK